MIAVHKDLEDADQMIHFSKIKTSVKDEVTDMKMVKAEKRYADYRYGRIS